MVNIILINAPDYIYIVVRLINCMEKWIVMGDSFMDSYGKRDIQKKFKDNFENELDEDSEED